MTNIMKKGASLEFITSPPIPPLFLAPDRNIDPSPWQLPIIRRKVRKIVKRG